MTEIERALAFYRDVFGWQRSAAEIHDYVVLEVPEDTSFGVSLVPQTTVLRGAGPTLYFAVDEPEEIASRAVAAGGGKRFGPTSLPGYGVIWQVEDPDGNRFGLFKR